MEKHHQPKKNNKNTNETAECLSVSISKEEDLPGYIQQGIPYANLPPLAQGHVVNHQQVIHYKPKNKPRDLLSKHASILIKQKPHLAELTGCEKENVYNVFSLKDGDTKGHKLFKCKEKSQFCSRNFMNPDCRPYNIIVYAYVHDGMGKKVKTAFLKLERQYRCTFCCCNRPVMNVSTIDESHSSKETLIGTVCHECGLCEVLFSTSLCKKEQEYAVTGSCTQCGFYCQCPCDACKEVIFNIKDLESNKNCGMIRKVWAGCEKEMLTDADNYICKMPVKSNWRHRCLFLSTVLLLDFQYFEENDSGNNQMPYGYQNGYVNGIYAAQLHHHHKKERDHHYNH